MSQKAPATYHSERINRSSFYRQNQPQKERRDSLWGADPVFSVENGARKGRANGSFELPVVSWRREAQDALVSGHDRYSCNGRVLHETARDRRLLVEPRLITFSVFSRDPGIKHDVRTISHFPPEEEVRDDNEQWASERN